MHLLAPGLRSLRQAVLALLLQLLRHQMERPFMRAGSSFASCSPSEFRQALPATGADGEASLRAVGGAQRAGAPSKATHFFWKMCALWSRAEQREYDSRVAEWQQAHNNDATDDGDHNEPASSSGAC